MGRGSVANGRMVIIALRQFPRPSIVESYGDVLDGPFHFSTYDQYELHDFRTFFSFSHDRHKISPLPLACSLVFVVLIDARHSHRGLLTPNERISIAFSAKASILTRKNSHIVCMKERPLSLSQVLLRRLLSVFHNIIYFCQDWL
jgi:hypothetical protein